MNQSRRRLLIGVGAALGLAAAYGLKAERFGALARRRVGKHPALAWPYGDTHIAMLKAMREMPDHGYDGPLIHYCHPGEYERIKAGGHDMHDCVLLGDIPSGKVHG